MGYYIETDGVKNKARYIKEHHEGLIVSRDEAERAMREGTHDVVVVVDNGYFEAAGFMFSMAEFKAFTEPSDRRTKWFVLLPLGKGAELSGYQR